MIHKLPAGETTGAEQLILRKLRWWIAALACACLVVGITLGATLSSLPSIIAQQTNATPTSGEIARAPEALSASFAEIARRVEPAVVRINAVTEVTNSAKEEEGADEEGADEEKKPGENALPDGLMELFRRQMRRPPAPRGIGSGFIVDSSGIIITNYHVVEGATRLRVGLDSGEQFIGRVVGVDEETDLAVVRVTAPRPLPTVKLGDSEAIEVGDWVLALGSPFELDRTVTAGIISTKERESRSSSIVRFIQTDAAINRGNSGGPLVNMDGEVIGINSQIATSTGDYNGIGFALPSNETAYVFRQIMTEGKVRRGYLGINLDSVRPEFARVFELPEAKGAIVTNVREREGPAASAGIAAGDVILAFNGAPVANAQELIAKVAATPVGQSVPVIYLREVNGKLERRTAQVRIGERPPPPASQLRDGAPTTRESKPADPNIVERPRLGIKTSELTPQLIADLNLRDLRGLLVTEVAPGSVADDAKLEVNMVIRRINRVPVTSNADFKRIIDNLKPGDPIVMNVATAVGGERTTILQFTFQ